MKDNFVQSFQLESSRIRGRIVRLGSTIEEILKPHDYPDDVLQLTGETLTLCALLSSMLKYEGIFTLQAQGKGPVRMVVSDVSSNGNVRACATFSQEELAAVTHKNPVELLGEGYLAFTVDQGEFTDRYQGIVELKPESLVASVQNYFTQSEQIATGIMLAVGRRNGMWRACGIMVQQMPEETTAYNKDHSDVDEDDWRRTMILLGSVKEDELLDADLSANDLLFRLFHEEGVRVFDPQPLVNKCRCSVDRVSTVLSSMSDEDIEDMTVDGKIVMKCEFCSRDYSIDPKDVQKGKTQ